MRNNPINLTLMIGPAVPVPVSQDVLDALTSVTVTTNSDSGSGFQLEFTLSNRSPLQTIFLLSSGAAIPLVRVLIVVTVNGKAEVLMDGVMTNHEVRPGADASHSILTVTGEDLSRLMDYIDFSGTPFPGMAPEGRVLVILAKYAALGILPLVIPSVLIDLPILTDRIPVQKGKDLCYIRSLAEEVGYVFYVEPGPKPGESVAYWGPEIKVGVPQKALSINMDFETNIESVSCSFDSQGRIMPFVRVQIPTTKISIPIPIPDITPLNPPLGLVPPVQLNFERVDNSAKYSPIRAAMIGLTKAARSAESVTATGSLDVMRYGDVLKARRLVGLRGVGDAFDGLYYVRSVTSKIKQGEFKQDFNLSRDGLFFNIQPNPGMNNKRDIGTCDKLYFGKHRGTVINNLDPMQMGRLQALVPDVLGDLPSSWAMPCLSVGGMQNGMFTVPIIGSGVWIEFEQGDLDYPIWTGCFYGSEAEKPAMAKTVPPGVPGITFQTPLQNGVTISDVPGPTGGILIRASSGAFIAINDVGIAISNGQGAMINLQGNSVDVNGGALTII